MERFNWDYWEQLAALHGRGADRYYDLEALIAGASLMGVEERAALALATRGRGVHGLDVLHLQCHLGCDAVTLARDGARVTGVDFSPTALERLGELARQCSVTIQTIEADSRDLPPELNASFDLVYATIGVLGWIDDLEAWMGGVRRVLRDGGTLVLVELHPLFLMIDCLEPLTLDFPYTFDGVHHFANSGSYAQPDADVHTTTSEYAHSLGEVVTAASNAGLTVAYLEEHTKMSANHRNLPGLSAEPDGWFRLRTGQGALAAEGRASAYSLPALYTLLATRGSKTAVGVQ